MQYFYMVTLLYSSFYVYKPTNFSKYQLLDLSISQQDVRHKVPNYSENHDCMLYIEDNRF